VLASSSEGKDRHFTNGYRRVVLDGVGHFAPREAPGVVADLLIEHLNPP
jgi:pimeloyl-ACP methyl ester carboxylesterase